MSEPKTKSKPKAKKPPKPKKTKTAKEVIAKVITDTTDEIIRFMPRLKSSENEYRELNDQTKEAKKTMEGNHLHLSMLCQRLADARNGSYQPGLPFEPPSDGAVPPAGVDGGAAQSIGVLKDHGLTDKMVETLVEHDVKTVGDLEKRIRDDEWWHKKIKGFGGERIDKTSDALVSFRKANPVTTPGEPEVEKKLVDAAKDAFRDAGILAE